MCNLKRIAIANIALGIALSGLGCVNPTEDTSTISSAHATDRGVSEQAEPGGHQKRAPAPGGEGLECAVGPEGAEGPEGLRSPIDLGQLQDPEASLRYVMEMTEAIRAGIRENILQHRVRMMRRMDEMGGLIILGRPSGAGGAEEQQGPGGSEGQRGGPGTD